MKIAFISYEYPPDTAYGGIATYVHQAAAMFAKRGHTVEVFTGSSARDETYTENNVLVHRIKASKGKDFRRLVATSFAARNSSISFDVVEGPEYEADAAEAVRRVPQMPLVIKLHTPSYLISQMNTPKFSLAEHLSDPVRFAKTNLKRLRLTLRYARHGKPVDIEQKHIADADEINFPSRSLGKIVGERWHVSPEKLIHVPYPYVPSQSLLDIPVETKTNVVTFLGRLEMRKGVLNLAAAIPLVLRQHPEAKIHFVGKPLRSPDPAKNMREYLEDLLSPYASSVTFFDPVPPSGIADVLARTDICVFPSLWENFPNVCLEAMAAARGIVGSSEGGMVDMLENGKFGQVVSPRSPAEISNAINLLLSDPARRQALGQAARQRVLTEYSHDRISTMQEESYQRAIEHRRKLGPRTFPKGKDNG